MKFTLGFGPSSVAAMVLMASLSLSGCSGKEGKKAMTNAYDLQFLDTMTAHHQGAIDMARMAPMNASHPELKQFAEAIIRDQQAEIDQMKQWRDQWYAGRPPAVNMDMPGMMEPMKGMDTSHMKGMSGPEFDRMFVDMMIPHHEDAITMASEAQAKAEHSELKQLAGQIIEKQRGEIEMMKGWKAAWDSH